MMLRSVAAVLHEGHPVVGGTALAGRGEVSKRSLRSEIFRGQSLPIFRSCT